MRRHAVNTCKAAKSALNLCTLRKTGTGVLREDKKKKKEEEEERTKEGKEKKKLTASAWFLLSC